MTTGLLIIDVQRDIVRGAKSPERQKQSTRRSTVGRLQTPQQRARAARVPVFVVQHDGEPGDRPGWSLRPEIAPLPGEALIHKKACDSFFETDLAARVQAASVGHLVIGGCMTQFCVDTTVRRAVSLGYDVTLLADGHSTADMGDLTFEQIIAHHNRLLNGFDAGRHAIKVRPSAEVDFR